MGLRGPGSKKRGERGRVGSLAPQSWQDEDLSRAERVIAFVESLEITQGKGLGGPFILRPWQKDIIHRLYDEEVGEAVITMGRKNGKTEFTAALALCHLLGPEAEGRGEVYSAAADKEQASRIFRSMTAFINKNPALEERVNIQTFMKIIEVLDGDGEGSVYRALSSDATKAHGLNPSFVVCDELAQWRGRELYDNLKTGFGARDRQMMVTISTASADPHSVMSELVAYGRQVLDGSAVDPSFAAVIYEVPISNDETEHRRQMEDEELWTLANPALGDFLSIEDMRKEAVKARRIPARESAFRNLKLNQPIEADERFIPGPEWEACRGPIVYEALRGRPCWAGLDLSSTQDLTSLVLYFPHDGGACLPTFWVPKDRLEEREERDKVPYKQWHAKGLIEAPDGRAIDRFAIAHRLAEIASLYDVRGIAYDRYRIEDLLQILDTEGIRLPLVSWGQGYVSMGPALDAMEQAILARELRHDGHQVLTWNVSNAVISTDPAGLRKLARDKCREKIDGLQALAMAVGLFSKQPALEDNRAFRADDVAAILSDEVAPWG